MLSEMQELTYSGSGNIGDGFTSSVLAGTQVARWTWTVFERLACRRGDLDT